MTKRIREPATSPLKHYETKSQLALRLHVTEHTIDVWRRQGLLTAYRLGGRVLLFDSAEVDASITASAV